MDATEAVSREKFLATEVYFNKLDRQIDRQIVSHLKELENKEQMKPKVSRRNEIINIRAEINESDQRRQQKRSMNLNACFLKR